MGRGGKRRATPRASTERPQSFRSHWRADGAPKNAYRSEGEALSVADERRQDTGVALTAYRCAFCSAWHLGTTAEDRA